MYKGQMDKAKEGVGLRVGGGDGWGGWEWWEKKKQDEVMDV